MLRQGRSSPHETLIYTLALLHATIVAMATYTPIVTIEIQVHCCQSYTLYCSQSTDHPKIEDLYVLL